MSDTGVSIRKWMDGFDRQHKLAASAIECYSGLINDVRRTVVRAAWPSEQPQPDLTSLLASLTEDAEPATLSEAHHSVSNLLEACAQVIRQYRAGAEGMQDAVALLELATNAMVKGGNKREMRLRETVTSMQEVLEIQDLDQLRHRLRLQTLQLVALADELAQENRATLMVLEKELATYRQRLEKAECDANTDPLCAIGNRRAMESRIEHYVESGTTFSLVLIDLDRFKQINDVLGHAMGDDLLKAFAGRIAENLRPNDFAARWGGDEFVILFNCSLGDAMTRVRTLQPLLCGRYGLGHGDRFHRIEVSATFAVAERHGGETAQQLFKRADLLLYKGKPVSS